MKNNRVCILNYGSGNIRSVFNMIKFFESSVVISNKESDILSATHIILPGVGAFGAAMEKIKMSMPLTVLESEVLKKGKPFLGICVGMQVLADKGFEFGEHIGLGWIHGFVQKLNAGHLALPHIGWNNIIKLKKIPLLEGLDENQDFYFVHSYVFQEEDETNVIARTEYGVEFTSIISKDNIFGVQFHPEKSQLPGRVLLKNFLSLK